MQIDVPTFIVDPQKKEINLHDLKVWKQSSGNFAGREVCLFISFAPIGRIGCGVQYFANCIMDCGIDVILCVVTDSEIDSLAVPCFNRYSEIYSRPNRGYDFAMWAAVLKANPSLWEAERIYFANDSLLGPLFDLNSMIDRIRSSRVDFIALTANEIDFYHAQSYFFVLQNSALRNFEVRKFWAALPEYSHKQFVIRNCEQMQLAVYRGAGLSFEILFDLPKVVAHLTLEERKFFNPTKDAWRELIEDGFPFIKADLVYRWRIHPDLPDSVSKDRRKIMRDQLSEIITARFSGSIDSNHQYLNFLKKVVGERVFFLCRSWLKRQKALRILG